MKRYFFFMIETLVSDDGEPREECYAVFDRIRRGGADVVVCAISMMPKEIQHRFRGSGLVEKIDAVRCSASWDDMPDNLASYCIVSEDSVVVGCTKDHLNVARKLSCGFCLAGYCADIGEFTKEKVRITSSLGKMLPLYKFYNDEKPVPIDYAIPFKNFCSPIRVPENVDGEKMYNPLAEKVLDEASNIYVLHVRDFATLVQAVDKIKYVGTQKSLKVFLRGQSSLYSGKIIPSAYRDADKLEVDKQIEGQISRFKAVAGKNFQKLDENVIEGLFQQYEQSSRWIDAVDNIWVALWFACQRRWEEGELVQYVRRNPRIEVGKFKYAYILILGANPEANEVVMDLREKTPSMFVRPHVQHGVLLQRRGKDGQPMADMTRLIQAVVRVDLEDALSWIGNSPSLSSSSMFPNPSFDTGFRDLIEDGRKVRSGLRFK